jgi:hypothetical protein
MAGISDVVTGLQNLVRSVGTIASSLSTAFPQSGATATTATGGGATLPGAPAGFLVVKLPNGTVGKVPYYNS